MRPFNAEKAKKLLCFSERTTAHFSNWIKLTVLNHDGGHRPATTSISTAILIGRRETSMAARAGYGSLMYWA